MSIESAKSFIERMKTDEEFARQVETQKDKDERMKFILAAGYDFTADEIKTQLTQLSDDDLANVAGGGTLPRPICIALYLFGERSDTMYEA